MGLRYMMRRHSGAAVTASGRSSLESLNSMLDRYCLGDTLLARETHRDRLLTWSLRKIDAKATDLDLLAYPIFRGKGEGDREKDSKRVYSKESVKFA